MYQMTTSPERKLKVCAIPVCKGKRFDLVHKFPMNNERAEQWIDAVDLPELRNMPLDIVRKRYFICSKHFRPQDYKNCESRSLNTTAYPRLHLKANAGSESENQTEQCSSRSVDRSSDDIHVLDYVISENDPIEIPEIDADKVALFSLPNDKDVVQYILCESNDTEIVIEKSSTQRTAQKFISTKSPIKTTGSALINRKISLAKPKIPTAKLNVKRNAKLPNALPAKKIHLPEKDENDAIDEPTGMLTLQHKSLKSPLNVCSFWLRDHCKCSKCIDTDGKRMTNIAEIPIDIMPIGSLMMENGIVCITWPGGHESSYNILDLHKELNAQRTNSNHLKPILWSAADIARSEYANVTLNDYLCKDDVAKDVVASLIQYGCAFIKNVPANLQSTECAVRRLFPIKNMSYGVMWSHPDSNRTIDEKTERIQAHNDQTYFSDAAGLQIMHCISRNGDDGEQLLVDGFYVAKQLSEQHPDAYKYLSQICVPSEHREEGNHFKHSAPIIVLDPDTNMPNQIRFNMSDRAFFNNSPQEKMLKFYKHYATLAKEIQLNENEWRFTLEPGTVCIFDNWRLLNGRTDYTGRRHMVGCYVARSEFLSVARRHEMIS